ncbi:MAG: hypothetical protein ACW964_17105 [Candidatus Hodarchaeales archaeon]
MLKKRSGRPLVFIIMTFDPMLLAAAAPRGESSKTYVKTGFT